MATTGFRAWRWLVETMWTFMLIATALMVARSLRSVLDCDYAGEVAVVLVDDGSKDDTAPESQRVRIISQANAGKSAALRRALAEARHEVIVFLDADTMFERATIRKLVEELSGERVGTVSGNARVGHQRNFVTRCQALEYICGFNLDRRASTAWN